MFIQRNYSHCIVAVIGIEVVGSDLLGRLIRSEEDTGVMVVLDRRLLSTKYGKRMVKGLPKNLPLIEASPTEIAEVRKAE